MAVEFTLPDLGEDIDEADVLKVLVSEGDEIAVDQPVLEIETEKATLDVPSTMSGRVVRVLVRQGETITPGQAILEVEAAGAQPEAAHPPEGGQAVAAEERRQAMEEAEREQAQAEPEPAAPAPPAPEPAREAEPAEPRAEAEAPAAEPKAPAPAARAAAPAAPPPPRVEVPGERPVFAAPSVRRFAREVGVEIREVEGSGPGGRISADDVKRHARALAAARAAAPAPAERRAAATAPETPSLPDFSQWGPVEREPLSRLRRTVARNMATSWANVPHVTLNHWADVTAIEEMRQEYKERAREAGGNLTLSVVMIKIAAAALRAHPKFNASLDTETNELILKRYYHIGVAVDTERGLVVPVIRDVDEKNIIQLSVELNDIAERARNNELTLEEMRGATFTVTNLGSLGTGHFSPIINYPEVAVLGLGRAERVPVWEDGQWRPRLRMPLSITHDHRVIDGADGARFMQWIADAVEKPLMLALEG